MLGFLVFLFYIIYNYLNATGNASAGRHFVNERTKYPKQNSMASSPPSNYSLRGNMVLDIHKSFLNSIVKYDGMNG